jgi:acyl transferase domain-containing protein/acyl carrier protein
MSNITTSNAIEGIAIVGMAGRFPGAKTIDAFWQNLRSGVESITFFTDEELIASGVDSTVVRDSNYVKAAALLDDIDQFDATFFGFNPREAAMMDPQQRIFLECAWEALENAGYDCQRCGDRMGVYAGVGLNQYWVFQIAPDRQLLESAAGYQTVIGNEKDFLTTRVSYHLNLRGPSLDVQTACSTSLVATSLACQSLLNYQCDMALAGGITIHALQKSGYFYQEGGIVSPDGHCRAFDAKAQGTVPGSGVGIVVLKRLEDALADGDCIHAVIKSSAINNDGSVKVGYTAPSVEGQAEVIAEALALAGVEADSISYVEAHGTGTALGDPIELAALTRVFRESTKKKKFCAIGSLKTNIGHLDAAAGVTGLIKTVLALQHKEIPPSLHFEQPNPQIDFANSPFYVNTTLTPWQTDNKPRRAAVSSLGIGGTNAHIILEEPPAITPQACKRIDPSSNSRSHQLLLLSAKTSSALEAATTNLANHLRQNSNCNLADVAYTLQTGRKRLEHRSVVVVRDREDAIESLDSLDPQRVFVQQAVGERSIVFMFPGQGSQYLNMGRELYDTELIFREQVDRCCDLLKPHLGVDLRSILYPDIERDEIVRQLQQTAIAQPALFVIEYALAQLWLNWGIRPQALIGHSIGEYVAACIAGVFSLEDALALVSARAQLMQTVATGAMLAVPLSHQNVQPLLGHDLSLAAINGAAQCVVSGSQAAIGTLQHQLAEQGIKSRLLHTSHAFHSQMMETIVGPFVQQVKMIALHPPQISYISNVTGTWITVDQATDPAYWGNHLRQTVRFADGIEQLWQDPQLILIEVGPGQTLSAFAQRHPAKTSTHSVLTSLRHPQEQRSDVALLLQTLGQLWLHGVSVDWSNFYAQEQRYRLPLPTYPFERQRYWIEPQSRSPLQVSTASNHGNDLINASIKNDVSNPDALNGGVKKSDIADWFYLPSWKRSLPPPAQSNTSKCWLVFVDEWGLGAKLAQRLERSGQSVVTVRAGAQFQKLNRSVDSSTLDDLKAQNSFNYTITPEHPEDYRALLNDLRTLGKLPDAIVHSWSVTETNSPPESLEQTEILSFFSLLFLAKALGEQTLSQAIDVAILSNQMQDITGSEQLCPAKALSLGPCKIIPQEYLNVTCRSIDVVLPVHNQDETLINQLFAELTTPTLDQMIAYRGNYRWVQTFEPVRWDNTQFSRLRNQGVYLITGGLGGLGFAIAEYLAQTVQAKLVLVGRSSIPVREEWEQWLALHDHQDETSLKIQKIQALEKAGAEVLPLSADVANPAQMQAVLQLTNEQFGPIHGVIHAAGVTPGGMLQAKTAEGAASILAPKVKGTLVLADLLKDVPLDFLVLCSSLTAILGGLGMVDHCAANAFLDAFACHHRVQYPDRLTVSVNWDSWQEVGQAANTDIPAILQQAREENLKQGILPKEGVEAFCRILQSTVPQVLISTRDFQMQLRYNDRRNGLQYLESVKQSICLHSRPALSNAYIGPRNAIEQSVVEIWQESLGIQPIGIYDNFFHLGGDSLLAVQIVSRLRDAFSIELSLQTLLSDAPTISELSKAIATLQPQMDKHSIMDELLSEIESLSNDEIQKQLEAAQPSDL